VNVEAELKKQLMKELEALVLARLCGAVQWLCCSHASAMIDVSDDTIQRRAVPWDDKVGSREGKIRYKHLDLNPGSRKKKERRYYAPDVLALLKPPACVRRTRN
jgi:hypothetical protein